MRLAWIGPLWIDLLMQIRLFGSRQNAVRRLARLEETGRLRYVGRISLDDCKPMHLWCNRPLPTRMLRHEVDLMRVFYAYWPHAYAVTGENVDPRWKADMELTIGPVGVGRTYMVEMDEGTEPVAQVRRRLAQYVDCPHAVLFVTPTGHRAEEIVRLTDNPRIYATTLDRCLADPWGSHWRNSRGEVGAVAKGAVFPAAKGAA